MLTPDEVQDEINRWLRADRFSVDWVTETDVVLGDLVDASAGALGGVTSAKGLRQMISTTTEYTLSIDVDTQPVPRWVRVRLRAGRSVVDQDVVDSSWWSDIPTTDTAVEGLLRRGAAAAAVMMLTRRYRKAMPALHGVTDPKVMFLLSEAARVDVELSRKYLNAAAVLDPQNRWVRYALLSQELREEQPGGEPPTDLRLRLIQEALSQVQKESENDPMLQIRVGYSAAACGTNSSSLAAQESGHQQFQALYKLIAQPGLQTEFVNSVKPAIVTGLATACRQVGCRRAAEFLARATEYSSNPRAMYNLACLYATPIPAKQSEEPAHDDRPTSTPAQASSNGKDKDNDKDKDKPDAPPPDKPLDIGIEYLEMALRAAPRLADFARTDRTLAPYRVRSNGLRRRFMAATKISPFAVKEVTPIKVRPGEIIQAEILSTDSAGIAVESADMVSASVNRPEVDKTVKLTINAEDNATPGTRTLHFVRRRDGARSRIVIDVIPPTTPPPATTPTETDTPPTTGS